MASAPTSFAVDTQENTKAIVRVDPQMTGIDKPPADDPTPDAPSQNDEQQNQQRMAPRITEALKRIRTRFLEGDSADYNAYLRRITRAFETFKNNPYILFNSASGNTDTLSQILSGINATGNDPIDLYQYNDNVYQMLGLTLIAALGEDVPRCRFQPTDPDNEADMLIAEKASLIQGHNERVNQVQSYQKKELLFLWVGGTYFKYVRNIVDANRAGVTRAPQVGMQMREAQPERYNCPGCGAATPVAEMQQPITPDGRMQCPQCQGPLSEADYYEAQQMPMPTKMGEVVTPNSMTAIDVFDGAHVRINPKANELYESKYLDLSGEIDIGTIRAAYPGFWKELGKQASETSDPSSQQAVTLRRRISSPAGSDTASSNNVNGTYSRTWMQPEAFNLEDDEQIAAELQQLFPEGVKLVMWGDDLVLDAVPDKMMDHWTQGKTIKGLGGYPFGIGDAALDVQARINDVANTIHAYLDRLAFGTILVDGEAIDLERMAEKPLFPGNMTEVYRKDESGQVDKPLDQVMFQPQFHIDSHIFTYQPQLIQLAQMLAGVQPQAFGGSDPNVQTKGGQELMLRQAMGRMKLFWDQIREEHAASAENSVRCTVNNMDDQMKIVVQGDIENSYQTVKLMRSQLSGDFLAYAESEEGFPTTFDQMQAQLMQLVEGASKNEFLMGILSEPDTQKVVARYILPNGVKQKGEAARTKIKQVVQLLAKQNPQQVPHPDGQPGHMLTVPSVLPDVQIDDFDMATDIARTWLLENWQQVESPGYQNVLAYLTIAKMMATARNIQTQQTQQALAAGPGGPDGPPPGGPPPPQGQPGA